MEQTIKKDIIDDKPIPFGSEARNMSIENKKNKRYETLRWLYSLYIEPAISEGKLECTAYSEQGFDNMILDELDELGYEVSYGQICDQQEGCFVDKNALIIKW